MEWLVRSFHGSDLTPLTCIYAWIHLSLSKGEGRVRVCGFSARTVLEPLTSRLRSATAWQAILSPWPKGRGGQKRTEFKGTLIREMICDALSKFWVRERGTAQGFSCHHG